MLKGKEVLQKMKGNTMTGRRLLALVLVFCLVVSMSLLFAGQALADSTLILENKDSSWNEITDDGIYGTLTYKPKALTFDYSFTGTSLADGEWSLIYACDPWPQTNSILLGKGTASSDISLSGSVDIGHDLPIPADDNYPDGAKIWLIPSSYFSTTTIGESGCLTGWPEPAPAGWLFEHELITYVYGEEPPQPCFIATAAYGAETAEQLYVLREFRDQVLLESTLGSQFVAWVLPGQPSASGLYIGK